jgi:hypothetical protein
MVFLPIASMVLKQVELVRIHDMAEDHFVGIKPTFLLFFVPFCPGFSGMLVMLRRLTEQQAMPLKKH